MATYFMNNEAISDGDGLSWETPFRNFMDNGIKAVCNGKHTFYVKATNIPYLTDPYGLFNADETYPSSGNSTWYFDATGEGTKRGSKKAILTGRKNYTGWTQVSGFTYSIHDTEGYLATGLGSYLHETPPVGSKGVWVNDIALVRVASQGAVVSGKFYYDQATAMLYFNAGETPSDVKVCFSGEVLEMNSNTKIYGLSVQYGKVGISQGTCDNWVFSEGEVAYCLLDGVHVHEGVLESLVQRNDIHDNGRDGINAVNHKINASVNRIYKNGRHGVFRYSTMATSCKVNQNTIIGNEGYGISLTSSGSSYTDVVVARNNISVENVTGQLSCQNVSTIDLAASNNCPGTVNMYGGKWGANKGSGNIEHEPYLNPKDFSLYPGSPCIDAGIDVGITADFYGRPTASKPDIGAVFAQRRHRVLRIERHN